MVGFKLKKSPQLFLKGDSVVHRYLCAPFYMQMFTSEIASFFFLNKKKHSWFVSNWLGLLKRPVCNNAHWALLARNHLSCQQLQLCQLFGWQTGNKFLVISWQNNASDEQNLFRFRVFSLFNNLQATCVCYLIKQWWVKQTQLLVSPTHNLLFKNIALLTLNR